MTRLAWLKLVFLRYYRNMGLRVLLYALLSLVATLISPLVNAFLGEAVQAKIEFSSVADLLTILASSMLAVSTFSLSIMVSSHRAAADAATPRVHRILLEDTTTQSVLAAFIGAFVYSLGSLILYHLGFYPEEAAFVAMLITTLVAIWVVLSLLRWIQHLTKLGSVEDTLDSAHKRAQQTLLSLARHPCYGASPLSPETVLPQSTTPLRAPCSGVLQLIDLAALEACLPEGASIYLMIRPGAHVLENETIGQVSGTVDAERLAKMARALTFGDRRTHEQDAEFGLTVLSEIAAKALSPGINDSGTAVETVLMLKSLLWDFTLEDEEEEAVAQVPRIFVDFPRQKDFVEAAFSQIARDGADRIEVALALRKALAALAASTDPNMAEAARDFAKVSLAYAEEAGLPRRSLDRLCEVQGL